MDTSQARPVAAAATKRKKYSRNAEATKRRILDAALAEFAKLGLGGARVDAIAKNAAANKGLIYAYFGSKDSLFTAVLEEAYLAIREAERDIDLEHLPPLRALETLVQFTWEYYLAHPEFLTLVNSENLHRGRHLKKSKPIRESVERMTERVRALLERGVASGDFRPGIDPVQINVTIAALGYYYLTNRFTGSVIYDREFMDPKNLEDRLQFNLETIRRLVRA